LIIADKKIPEEAKQNLSRLGNVEWFATEGIVYNAISGHPDIFFFQHEGEMVVSPNLPDEYITLLNKNLVKYKLGKSATSAGYPASAHYNAAVICDTLIHKLDITDEAILSLFPKDKRVNIKQGYGRCSTIPLKGNNAITSDAGIQKTLTKAGYNALYVSPEGIMLPGFKNGFIGGTCGALGDTVYFLGNLQKHIDGENIRSFLQNLGYNIVELCDTPLFDGGSILFVN